MRINEIFYSLQGEGRWTGTPAVFVRFAGCNLRCPFCDTDHNPYREYSEGEIVKEISAFPTSHVIFTGGEPTLQLTASLADAMHGIGKQLHIETNGSIALDESLLKKIDWITCSPKEAPVSIQRYDELKLLFEGEKSIGKIERFSTHGTDPSHTECRYLQPLDTGNAALNKSILTAAIDYIKSHPIWKLSLQTHKILDIR